MTADFDTDHAYGWNPYIVKHPEIYKKNITQPTNMSPIDKLFIGGIVVITGYLSYKYICNYIHAKYQVFL